MRGVSHRGELVGDGAVGPSADPVTACFRRLFDLWLHTGSLRWPTELLPLATVWLSGRRARIHRPRWTSSMKRPVPEFRRAFFFFLCVCVSYLASTLLLYIPRSSLLAWVCLSVYSRWHGPRSEVTSNRGRTGNFCCLVVQSTNVQRLVLRCGCSSELVARQVSCVFLLLLVYLV